MMEMLKVKKIMRMMKMWKIKRIKKMMILADLVFWLQDLVEQKGFLDEDDEEVDEEDE